MGNTDKSDDFLNDLFQEAQQDPASDVSLDLMARVLADAEAMQPAAPASAAEAAEKTGLLSALYKLLGGWQGTSGLVAATMASVWIGFSGGETFGLDGLQTIISGDTDYYLTGFSGDFSLELGEG